ncbi:hypothetical protein CCMSSC00406_0009045 [Pleurotus cornucopiae]|uniref:Uncharacterized protein n=1 Tax=Pleurotus cornucopiae TaxID=5321 RepID=A0ACB7J0Y7_PLECO|nr:hypothetical protein CCMSSC00406_0009045 [Pleurotus cornucopiae]
MTAQLTHLELQSTFYSQRFVDFLERNTALQFIHVGQLGRDTKDHSHPTLPSNAVPHLRSIGVPLAVLQQFGGRTSLLDLDIPDLIAVSPASLYDIEAAFSPVRALSVNRIYFTDAPSWVSLLPNLRDIRVQMPPVTICPRSQDYARALSGILHSQSDMNDSWRALSRSNITYIRFQSVSMPREPDHPVRRLFEVVQSLALVDVGVVGGLLFYRYYRHSERYSFPIVNGSRGSRGGCRQRTTSETPSKGASGQRAIVAQITSSVDHSSAALVHDAIGFAGVVWKLVG